MRSSSGGLNVEEAKTRELCDGEERVDERVDKSLLWWFRHIEGTKNSKTAKRVYSREGMRNRPVGRLRKRWRFRCWESE